MHTTRYTLETITPLFLRGPDGETPELRPPSFKGMLRYWWRALHPMPVDDLRQKEARRFGSAGDGDVGRSPVQLRLRHDGATTDSYEPVPTHNFQQSGFSPGQQFDLVVTVGVRGLDWRDEIDATFRLMLLLGGLGNRSRRGFGSLRLAAVDGTPHEVPEDPLGEVAAHLDRLDTSFERDGRTIMYAGGHADTDGPDYPWVRRIETGTFWNGWREAVQSIAQAASRHDSSYTGDINPRLSSPVYVSVGADDRWCWPMVTSLNLPPSTERSLGRHERDTRAVFRDALL
jgi:CRISPR-associated protein Cmr1